MFDIDKEAFGAFILELRKEKGFTQKELAERLMVSDKAVSKWERALSLPDVTLLIPLSEVLGVTVTELLECRRRPEGETMDAEQTEAVVKKALSFTEQPDEEMKKRQRKSLVGFLFCAGIAAMELLAIWLTGNMERLNHLTTFWTFESLSLIFGGCFVWFLKEPLPAYYDLFPVSYYSKGIFRIHFGGLSLNNRNWPHIVRALRIWGMVSLVCLPALYLAVSFCVVKAWETFFVVFYLGSLFLPVYWVGKKYEAG